MDRTPSLSSLNIIKLNLVFQEYFYGLVAHTSCIVFLRKMDGEKKNLDQSLIYLFYIIVLTSMIRSVRNCFLLWCFLITSKVLLLYYNYVYICTRFVP